MTINLDLVVETEEDSVDMKAGLDSMQGVSDAVRCVAETILTENIPKRQTHKSVLVKPKWTRLIDNFHTQPESYHH